MNQPQPLQRAPTTTSAPPRERRWWTSSEDEILQNKAQVQMDRYGSVKNWNEIAALLPYRTNKDCRKRWYKVRRDIRKGAWMPEEDKQLEDAVAQVGLKWSTVARIMQTRNADQCAKRWQHVLGPDFKHAPWTPEEDKILLEAIAKYGNNWKQLGMSELPDRSTHDIRNRSVTLSRRNGRAAQKPLQPPSPGPSEAPSLEDDCSSRHSSIDDDSDMSCTEPLQVRNPGPGNDACWSVSHPPSALIDPSMDEPFFSGWGALDAPSQMQPLRNDFDPWMQLEAAAAAGPTGLQTPPDSEFLMTPAVVAEENPLDLCFLDETLAGPPAASIIDEKMNSPHEQFYPAAADGGLGSSPQTTIDLHSCGAQGLSGAKGSVTVLLKQSDSHLTQGVVRSLMGLDVDLTIRVVRD